MPFVSTVDNFADFFTKALAGPQFFKLRDAIMNINPVAHSTPAMRLRGVLRTGAVPRLRPRRE